MPCGATTLTKHVVEVRHVAWMNKIQDVGGLGKSLFLRFGGGCNGSNLGRRFGKPGGGQETRGGGDGLEGSGG
ncbi:hypothetical protein Tco_1051159 [Tanacetum coccineum]